MSAPWLRRIAVAAILIAAAATLRLTLFRPHEIPVTVFRVAKGLVEETVTNSKAGSVKSRRRATLSTELGGRVAELPVRKGDRVRAGQVLVRLADGDVRAQVAVQERSLEAARAGEREACVAADQAVKDLERNESLARDRVIAASLLDQFRSRRDATEASCAAARARVHQAASAVDLARVDLAKTVLRAPFDGVVAELKTEVGEWITPSPPAMPVPPVIELIDTDAVYVSAPLDEVDVGRVKSGLLVRVSMDAYPARTFPGRVVRVAPYVQDVQEQNRTFEIEVDLDDPAFAKTLVPGSSADVEVVLDTHADVLRVPSHAVLEGGKVLVVRDGKLVAVEVKTGLKNWAFTEVVGGLSSGDLVTVSLDDPAAKEGARVRVAGESAS